MPIAFIDPEATIDKIVIDQEQAAQVCRVLKVLVKRELFLFPSLHPIIVVQFSFFIFSDELTCTVVRSTLEKCQIRKLPWVGFFQQ